MATIIQQHEGFPSGYPDTSDLTLSTAAAALDKAMLWQRIENYVAHRWTERAVTWIVEGPGEWTPPLTPATIDTVAAWSPTTNEYIIIDLPPSPLGGFVLPHAGPFRFTGTAGSGTPNLPEGVLEAYRRLAEYSAQKPGKAGADREGVTAGSISLNHSRSPAWMANAMQNSGAADLLRNYRRAA